MIDRIDGSLPACVAQARTYDLHYPKVGSPIDCTMLCDRIVCAHVHWIGSLAKGTRRTVACTRREDCQFCLAQAKKDGRGFFAAHSHRAAKVDVVVVGVQCVRALANMCPIDRTFFRLRVNLVRLGHANTNHVIAIATQAPPVDWDQPMPDIKPSLRQVYGQDILDALTLVDSEGGEL